MKFEGAWGVKLCRLLYIYRRFGGMYLHLQGQALKEVPYSWFCPVLKIEAKRYFRKSVDNNLQTRLKKILETICSNFLPWCCLPFVRVHFKMSCVYCCYFMCICCTVCVLLFLL